MDDHKLQQASKTNIIIQSAMVGGATFFLALALLVGFVSGPPEPALAAEQSADMEIGFDDSGITILAIILAVFCGASYTAATIMFKRTLNGTQPSEFLGRLSIAYLIRGALLEGCSFFGILILLLMALDNFVLIRTQPLYLLVVTPYLIQMVVFWKTLPTVEKLKAYHHQYDQT